VPPWPPYVSAWALVSLVCVALLKERAGTLDHE
jgi:hypothetical protein